MISNAGSSGDVNKFGFAQLNGGAGELISSVTTAGYGGQLRFDHNTKELYARYVNNMNYGSWVKIASLT